MVELFYHGTTYTHADLSHNWFKIGSDVRQHSFLFRRDKAIFYGSLRLTNALSLGAIGTADIAETKPTDDDEITYEEGAKCVNYKELKVSPDGTVFYDKNHKIVVIKINGTWVKLALEALPIGIQYKF